MDRNAKETQTLETLAEAASRLLAELERRAKKARPLAENARPFLRLVAANANERREPEAPGGTTLRRLPQVAAPAPGSEAHVVGVDDGANLDELFPAFDLDDDW